MLEENPDEIKLVVKPFPRTDSPSSLLIACAALAAHAQGCFWEFREQLFLFPPHSVADLQEIADGLAMDAPRLFRDLASSAVQQLLISGINDGVARGVVGTPTVFVNQTPLPSLSREALHQAVRQATGPQ